MKIYSPLTMFLKIIFVNLHVIMSVCMFIFVFNSEIEEASAKCMHRPV